MQLQTENPEYWHDNNCDWCAVWTDWHTCWLPADNTMSHESGSWYVYTMSKVCHTIHIKDWRENLEIILMQDFLTNLL